jgi:hypothetical protein
LDTYPQAKASGLNPLEHYVRHGARENYDPSPRFSTSWYRERYHDIDVVGVNPLAHYLAWGMQEDRSALPVERT